MNKFIAIIFLFTGMSASFAQQEYSFTHYFEANSFFNPASVGSQEGQTIMGVFRKQWLGVEGSPTTGGLLYDTQLSKYNMGLGGYVFTDKIGETNLTTVTANYAYKLKMNETLKLSFGANAGADFISTDFSRLEYWDEGDQVIPNGRVSTVVPKVGLGLSLEHEKFYVGLSVPRVLNFNSTDFHSINSDNIPMLISHYYLTAGYKFQLNDDFGMSTNTLVKYAKHVIPQVDLNATVTYRELIGLGFGYKSLGFFSSYVQYTYDKTVTIGYAFDLSLNPMSNYSRGGTHELMVKYNLKSKVAKTRI